MKKLIITNLHLAIENGITFSELANFEKVVITSKEIEKVIKSDSCYFHLVIASVYANGNLHFHYRYDKNPF
jgi:hypothetical protein